MKKLYAIIIGLILALNISGQGFTCEACKQNKNTYKISAVQQVQQKPAQLSQTAKPGMQTAPAYVAPLDVLYSPGKYLNKPVHIIAKFDKFSTLGLDYAPAMRPSSDYIAFLVQRSDVIDHNIPLSEVKFFLKREYAEKFIDLDTGDKIEIDGKMFSNALNDVWIDVDKIEIKEKVKKTDNK